MFTFVTYFPVIIPLFKDLNTSTFYVTFLTFRLFAGRDFSPHTRIPFHHTHNALIRNPIKLMLDNLIPYFCRLLVHAYKQ